MIPKITDAQFSAAAITLGCKVSTIKAVNKVEARGSGFLPDGKIKILFEPHIFWQQLQKVARIKPTSFLPKYADILYPKWTRGKYGKESEQHGKLNRACLISREASLMSASWGSFQIMGFNFAMCGFKSVEQMVAEFAKGEYEQLLGFVNYVKNAGLAKYLVKKDFVSFAKYYNGTGYKGSPFTTNDDYDLKLIAAEKDFDV
jgi:hypothetical protein